MEQKTDIRLEERLEEAWGLRYSDPERALSIVDEVEGVLDSGDPLRNKAELIRRFVRFLYYREKEVLEDLHRLTQTFQQREVFREAAIAHDLLARIADAYGEYGRGTDEVLKGIDLLDRVDDRELHGELLATKGNLLNRTGDHEAAIEELEKALSIRKELGEERGIASALNLLGRSYTLNEDPETGLRYYEESRTLRESIGDEGGLPWTYLGMGTALEKAGRFDEALQRLDSALEVDRTDHTVLQLLVRTGKARCMEGKGQAEHAINEASEALKLAEQVDSDPLRCEVLQALYKAEKAAGQHEKALEHLEEYQAQREQVQKASEKDRIRFQEQAFHAEKKEKEAEIQRLRNVELKHAYEALEEKNKEIRDSLNYASRIQEGLLPGHDELQRLFPNHFVLFRPVEVVSGDFYWAADAGKGDEERRFFVAADCTGHGVPGAFMSLLGVSFLNELILEKQYRVPSDILDQLRERVINTLNPSGSGEKETRSDGMDLTLIAYLPQQGVLEFAAANNPLYLVRHYRMEAPEGADRSITGNGATLYEFGADRQPVGFSERKEPFNGRRIRLAEGDRIYLLSDGFPDQFGGPKGKKFKYRRLKETLLDLADRPMDQQREALEEHFRSWSEGYEQVDDVILAGIGFGSMKH